MRIKIDCPQNHRELRITNADTGEHIKAPISAVQWSVDVRGPARARVELAVAEIGAEGEAEFCCRHPVTGRLTPVESIVFADGSRYDF